jgi:hypothetical protein
MRYFCRLLKLVAVSALAACVTPLLAQTGNQKPKPAAATPKSSPTGQRPRDIIFIVMDDVGIDEMTVFGFGKGRGPLPPPLTPNINAIAQSGVMFGNTWVMPECSPSRAAFFTGRYPMRTGVTAAIVDNMLPSSQVSPYETTTPRVLAQAGYTSALIGKFHLGTNNPIGDCSPAALGWNHYDGYVGASPGAIDNTAGNGTDEPEDGPWICGFNQSGASGACYQGIGGACQPTTNGKVCLESGGLFIANQSCVSPTPSQLDFARTNSYFVWQDAISEGPLPQNIGPGQCGVQPTTDRDYMTTVQTDTALNWWKSTSGPRMLTVAYAAVHTPFQQPPNTPDLYSLACQGSPPPVPSQWVIANAEINYMDGDIGRMLQGMGLATLDSNGVIKTVVDEHGYRHIPELEASGAMVIIIGDNGQFGPLVEEGFDPAKAKGTVYQTGVWVPLVVAGSLVQGPTGRMDNHMINSVDLFQLFGEIAGLNVDEVVQPAHILDSVPMLVHLTDPNHGETRTHNFTQQGPGTQQIPITNATRSWPCVIGGTIVGEAGSSHAKLVGGQCSDVLFVQQSFCELENNGIWLGPRDPAIDAQPLKIPNTAPGNYEGAWNSCCAVRAALNLPAPAPETAILPVNQWAERDTRYKYIEREFADCSKPLCPGPQCDTVFPPFERTTVTEFYELGVATTDNPFGIDMYNLACDPTINPNPIACVPITLHPEFLSLKAALHAQLDSEPDCTGDGNLDKRVNEFDLEGVTEFQGAGPSVWDFNDSGQTDQADIEIVKKHLGTDCIGLCRRADLDRDGVVDAHDLALLLKQVGKPCELCSGDLNGDGVVNQKDVALMKEAIRTCSKDVAAKAAKATSVR